MDWREAGKGMALCKTALGISRQGGTIGALDLPLCNPKGKN